MGEIHGREGLSVVTCLHTVSRLVTLLRERNEWILHILSDTMVWVIPSLNPDTHDYNVVKTASSLRGEFSKRYGMQRKNMKETCPPAKRNTFIHIGRFISSRTMESGVDLNRNFPVCFDVDEFGSSSIPCSDIYRVCFESMLLL